MNIALPSRPYDGINLMPIIEGELSSRPAGIGFVGNSAGRTMSYIDGNFKIYTNNGGETFELFNLGSDESEEYDLSASHPEKLRDMVAKLSLWKKSVESSATGSDYR